MNKPARSEAERGAGRAPDRPSILAVGMVALLAAAVYANTLSAGFTLDDVKIVETNPQIRNLANLPAIFTTHYWASDPGSASRGLYRPITILSFALNYTVHGGWAPGYHLANVLLHAAASAMLVLLLARLFADSRLAIVAGALFAAHPVHTEAVAGVVGRAEVLALLGVLTCCYAFERARDRAERPGRGAWAWVAVSVGAYVFGAMSKEIGLLAPVVILVTEWILPERRFLLRRAATAMTGFVAFAGVGGLFLVLRAAATEPGELHGFFQGITTAERVWTAIRVCGEYFGLLLAPWRLQADYWLTDVPIAQSPVEAGVLAGAAILLAGLGLLIACRRRAPAATWGLAVFIITLVPVSNLVFPIGVLKAERILYSPSAGFVTAVSAGLIALGGLLRMPRLPAIVATCATLVCAGRTWVRNADWRDNESLARATLAATPDSPIFNVILGNALVSRNEGDTAREHYLRALKGAPRLVDVLYQLGNLERDAQRYALAIEWYEKALAVQPNLIPVLNNLGRVQVALRDWPAAVRCFNRVLELDADEPRGYLNLINVYLETNSAGIAEPLAVEAMRRFPNHAHVFLYASRVYRVLGRPGDADAVLRRARELDPSLGKR